MRTTRLLVIFIALLTFSNSKLISQINSSIFSTALSLDSLNGFDEDAENNNALTKGFYGKEFNSYMNLQKRMYINKKYGLVLFDYEADYIANFNIKKYTATSVNAAPCVNEGFEANSFTGWAISQGTSNALGSNNLPYGACFDNPCPTPISSGSLASIVQTPYSDAFLGIQIPNSPFAGNKVARLNTEFINNFGFEFRVTKMTQNFPVTTSNSQFDFAYFAVMDGTGNHACCEQPYMYVKLRDCFGNLLGICPVFSITVPGGAACPGTGSTSWLNVGGIHRSNGWQQYSIDLATYIGCNVTIEVTVGHCQFGGHFGYAYFDSECNQMNVNVNGNNVNIPTTSPVSATVACATTATLTAPIGLQTFTWNGPAGSGISNNFNQTIVTSIPGSYSLGMHPTGICNDINRIITLSFPPPTTITVSNPNLCASGSNTVSTLSASGALQYTWQPGGSTSTSITVSPTITTIYTLTARTGTCIGTFTTQITVNPNPGVTAVSSNTSVCPGQPVTLTAFNANSYVWQPGGSTNNPLTVTQTSATSYTVVGTSLSGCSGSAVVNVGMTSAPNTSISTFPASNTLICRGTSVVLIATGANNITWQPGGSTSAIDVFTPTVTTTYTAFGTSGSCASNATIIIVVDQGPPITTSSTPSPACPGTSVTLNAVSPLAVGAFTWNPGSVNASSIVVTATIAGGYSVSAKNAMGCVNTQTINPNYSALPNIVISPTTPTVCMNNSVTLTASGGVSYTWQPGGIVATTIAVSPTVNTSYTVTGANGAGCIGTRTVMVTVIQNPTISASASPSAICAGDCATITPLGASVYTIEGITAVKCITTTTTYTVIGRNAAGCLSNTVSVTIPVNPLPTISVTANPTIICPGGSSTLTASGGATYTWSSGGNGTTTIVSPTLTTTYTLTGASALGCRRTATVTVVVSPIPTINITPATPSICIGGTVNLVATGAPMFTWQPVNVTTSNVVVSPTTSTTYTAIGSNGTCVSQRTVMVFVSPNPTLSASYSPSVICAGSCATITTTGVSSFTVSGLTNTACPLVNTNYTVIGTNALGCRSNTVIGTLSVTPAPNLTATPNPATICAGSSSTLTALGGVNYTWSSGGNASTTVVSPTITTTYTLTGVNATGCGTITTVTVNVLSVPNITITPSSATICAGASVNLTATGATNYTWNPGPSFGANFVASPTTTTTYTVNGSNGTCTGSRTVAVTVNPVPNVSITTNPNPPVICAGNAATLTANGAANYTWSNGATTANNIVTPSLTTTYVVFGTSLGCQSNTVSVTVTVNPAPLIGLTANPTSICVGSSSTLTPSGGTSYTLQPGGVFIVSPTITTIYTLTGQSALGCTATANATVFVNPPVTMIASASPSTICFGSVATLTASGASGYTWQPTVGPLTGSNVIVAPAITTIYTVTGANGVCTGQNTVQVVVNPNPTVNVTSSSPSICAGSCATLTATGAPNYAWSMGLTGSVVVVCPTVTTSYSVVGSSGSCSTMTFITIFVNPPAVITASANPAVLCGGASSSTLSATGGTSYIWQPGSVPGSSMVVSPSVTTVYTVTGTNAQGCSAATMVTVTVSPAVVPFAVASPTSMCIGGVSNLGAGGASTYTWFTGTGTLTGPNVTVSPISTTIYTVVAQLGGCTGQTTVEVVITPSISVSISATSTSLCAGNCATLIATGGNTYTWTTGASSPTIVICPTSNTVIGVVGINANCTAVDQVTLSITPAPSLSISSTPGNSICAGTTVTLTAQGASTYTWSTGSNQQSIVLTPSSNTVISLTGSTGPSCNATISHSIAVTPAPNFTVAAIPPTICAGLTVSLVASAPTVTWFPNGVTANPFIDTPASTTIYTAVAANGLCVTQRTVQVTVSPLPTVSVTANPPSVCAGQTTTLTATGAVTYSWIPSLQGGNTFTDNPTAQTEYTVVGFSAAGCPNFDVVTVNVVGAPSISLTSNSPSVCLNATGTLTASGATNYTWVPSGQSGSTFTFTQTTTTPVTYTVLGDNGGCVGIQSISIGAFPLANVNASASSLSVCPGNTVMLTGTGAVNYTWTPPNQTGATIVDAPFVTTQYTLTGEDANGCRDTANVLVNVNPLSNITVVASPSNICEGATVNLTANGGLSYTWSPGGANNSAITVTPNVSTVYTLEVNDVSGCVGIFTVPVNVFQTPTISITPFSPSICAGSTTTLTATGAMNYTWLPTGGNGSVAIESPTSTTNYTLIGDNGGICSASLTFTIFVNPVPAHVGAASIGTVGCASPNATLLGTSTDTNVSYSWAGPQGYTSSQQDATVTAIWGTFTVTVTDNITGCSATATVDVPTDNTIPLVTAVASGSINCSVSTVTVDAVHTTTNPGYSWAGPGGFAATTQSITVTTPGDYTITVTDLSSTCSSTAMVSVGIHTNVMVTASIAPATCSNGVSNNDGSISVFSFTVGDKYDLVSGPSYTGTANYASAAFIPTSGVIVSNLANPTTTLAFSIRIFDAQGCTKDTTLILVPVDCSMGTLGIAKAVSTPTLNSDGSYKVKYTIIVKNYDTVNPLSNVSLIDNLSSTFPAPATYTVVNDSQDSTSVNAGSGLIINESFDGGSQSFLLSAGTNSLAPNQADTIWFTVNVHPNVFFVTFNNTVLGEATNTSSTVVRDSSNTGLNPDPDEDLNPINNNIPTSITFTPNVFFGITKVGDIYATDNNSYDVSYTVTVHNLGNDTLRNVTLDDILFQKAVKNPATYIIRSAPVSLGGGLVANASYDGNTNISLVDPSQSKIAPNTRSSIHFIINLVPDSVTRISNSAFGSALAAVSPTATQLLSDTSNAGTNPDSNQNGIWNEPEDNRPTVLLVPVTYSLFIPEGFSPNGDNINDNFVIQGLSTTGDNPITIFNRWGNKVYQNSNYDNSWDGRPNVSGTLGKDKLPPGTYYYILEMKGSGKKSITGFVVLQY